MLNKHFCSCRMEKSDTQGKLPFVTVFLDYKEEPKIKFIAETCYQGMFLFHLKQLAGWLPSLSWLEKGKEGTVFPKSKIRIYGLLLLPSPSGSHMP